MKDYGRNNSEHISVGNWMLTLFFRLIPGILLPGIILIAACAASILVLENWLYAGILMAVPAIGLIGLIFCLCSKKKSKRNYAVAVIAWVLIFALIIGVGYIVLRFGFPTTHDDWMAKLKDLVEYAKDLLSNSGGGAFLLP